MTNIPDGYEECGELEADTWLYEGKLYIHGMGGPKATPLRKLKEDEES